MIHLKLGKVVIAKNDNQSIQNRYLPVAKVETDTIKEGVLKLIAVMYIHSQHASIASCKN